jgi:cyanate lyase
MNRKKEVQLLHERKTIGTSYRKLASKYGCSLSHVSRMMKRQKRKQEEEKILSVSNQVDDLPDDVKVLKEALRKERLKNELLNIVVDISGKELGVDLRKKYGAKQSR